MQYKKNIASLILASSFISPAFAATPATAPATMSMQEATAQLHAKLSELFKALDKNNEEIQALTPATVLVDATKRAEIASKVLDLLHERIRLLTEQTHYTPRPVDQKEMNKIQAMLYLFKDAETTAAIDAMLNGPDVAKGEGVKIRASWIAAGGDPARQMAVAGDADKVAAKYPDNQNLTLQIVSLVSSAADLDTRNALLKVCTQTMNNQVSKDIIAELEQNKAHESMQAAAAKQKAFVGQPMTVEGPTVDGAAFSTVAWKGKVVVVDFWATWCGPCKAELPHVKALYDQYHEQGLEIVGVSSDESAKPLKAYTAEHNINWTQLFDADAAAKEEQSSIAKRFNIAALPTMFLIDKNGVCRSVTARTELDTMIPKLLAEAGPAVEAPATRPVVAAAPATQPDLQSKMINDVGTFQRSFDPSMLADAKARAKAQADVIPAAKTVLRDLIALADQHPNSAPAYRGGVIFYATVLAAFGDADGQGWIDAMANDEDPRTSLLGKTQQLYVRWCRSTEDAAIQTKVVDDAEVLAKANPTSNILSHQLLKMAGQGAADPALADRLSKLVPESMKNPAAQKAVAFVPLADRVGKPMTLEGTTPAGSAFTTANLKGKVILVDFWAVWCGPCKRELPRVKAIYEKYHSQGLEVLGVSNDYDAKDLSQYIAENNLPWPQLFDAKAAAQQAMHPLTSVYNIQGIPTMFLIDKNGVCRSVTARETMEQMIPSLLAE